MQTLFHLAVCLTMVGVARAEGCSDIGGVARAESCSDIGGISNGCSAGFGARITPESYQALFEAPCDRHDICYRCAGTQGYERVSRGDCDRRFYERMSAACWGWDKYVCKGFAWGWYKFVDVKGGDYFTNAQKADQRACAKAMESCY